MPFVGFDYCLYQIIGHRLAIFFGHHVKCERQHIGRSSIVTIENAVGIQDMWSLNRRSPFLDSQELLVESILYLVGIAFPC